MEQSIWISYDLGIKGDYSGLYRWLDIHKAKECGNNVAFLRFKYNTNLAEEIKRELSENIEFKSGDRIYIITSKLIEGKQATSGQFIIGNRKASPWEGYAPTEDNSTDF
ncbi:MAG: hypothetical protein Q8907_06280 [Bacteroidota bacterium]|nr:hypothetical protein [Bacteroidota bacterium]